MPDMLLLPALDLVALMHGRELSPVELMTRTIERIETADPVLNAIVSRRSEGALCDAQEAEKRIAKRGPLPALTGLPLVVKDLTDTEQLPTTFGSPDYSDRRPQRDDPVVAALRRAGAIVLGKSNTPEFGIGGTSDNRLFGTTRNPWNPELTCGGSSGGSAVAVATGMAALASGTDSGGSLRNPAAYCGVVGFRPTPGVVPVTNRSQAWSPFSVNGPMARRIDDAIAMLRVMTRAESRDPIASGAYLGENAAPHRIDEQVLGVSEDLGFAPVDENIRRCFRAKITRLEADTSMRLEPLLLDFPTLEQAALIVRNLYLLTSHRHRLMDGENLEYKLVASLEAAQKLNADEIAWALREQAKLCGRFDALFSRVDAIVTPVVSVAAFPVEQDFPEKVEGRRVEHYAQWLAITYGAAFLGLPALSIPCGRGPDNLPFGLQVIGPRFGDRRLLLLGRRIEEMFATAGDQWTSERAVRAAS